MQREFDIYGIDFDDGKDDTEHYDDSDSGSSDEEDNDDTNEI